MAASKTNLVGLGKEDMESFFTALDAKAFHGRNVLKWIHKHGVTSFDAMTDVPKALRERLAESAEIALPRIALAQPARDGTTKWLLELADGQFIETVYIPDAGRSTICVSSQVGCALDCAFCSTAQQGFNRNLSVAEIIGQVWIAARAIGHMPTNVVIGTSLFQIIFVTAFTTILHATANQTVDVVLAFLLMAGGVAGAQYGAKAGQKLRGEQLRALLALLVLAVALRLGFDLFVRPSSIYTLTPIGGA